MSGRRLLTLGVIGFLIATVLVVIADLRQAFRDRPLAATGPLKPGSATLDQLEPESPFVLETEATDGAPQFALLTETEPAVTPLSLTGSETEVLPVERARPKELPDVETFQPVPPLSEAERQERVKAIKQIHPDASEDDIQFWLKETKGLPTRMLRDMLKLRQEIGPLSEDFGMPERPLNAMLNPGAAEANSSLPALEAMRKTHLENLLNAESIGYRRRVLITVEDLDEAGRRIVRIADSRLALERGETVRTDDPLDVVLFNERYFFVVTSAGQQFLTRNGNLAIGPDRRVIVQTGGGEPAVLAPGITVPENVQTLRVDEAGQLYWIDPATDERANLGRIQIGTVDWPQYLKPAKHGLYRPTARSGAVNVISAAEDVRLLIAGQLERANVIWAQEEAKLLAIEKLISWTRDEAK